MNCDDFQITLAELRTLMEVTNIDNKRPFQIFTPDFFLTILWYSVRTQHFGIAAYPIALLNEQGNRHITVLA